MPDFQIEKNLIAKGFSAIAGIDEAGRGALFGPVVASAVAFSPSLIKHNREEWIREIHDSKLLSPKKRRNLARLIVMHSRSVGIGITTNQEIDLCNIYWASLKAMRRAILNMPVLPDFLLVDGFHVNDVHYPQLKVLHGDRRSISIAAASIVAKVFRDEMIARLDPIYEGYFLKENKGYGTKNHYKGLKQLGPTLFHRKTFNLEGKG